MNSSTQPAPAVRPPSMIHGLELVIKAAAWFYCAEWAMNYHRQGFALAGYGVLLAYFAGGACLIKSLPSLDLYCDLRRLSKRFHQRAGLHVARLGTIADALKAGLLVSAGWLLGTLDGKPLRYAGQSSLVYFAPSRVGKTLAIMAALILWRPAKRFAGDSWGGSQVIYDCKGEIGACTARAQREHAHRDVYFLCPWVKEMSAELGMEIRDTGFTGFSDLDPTSPDLEADAAAKMMILLPDPPDAKDEVRFFKQAARDRGVLEILGLLSEGLPVTLPAILERAQLEGEEFLNQFAKYRVSTFASGALARMANKVWGTKLAAGPQYEGGLGELLNELLIFSPASSLGRHVCRDELTGEFLKKRECAVYILVPTRYIESHSGWARWVIGNLIEGAARVKNNRAVLVVIDEAARVGLVSNLIKAMELYPSAGISILSFWQSIAAGVMVYGKEGFRKLCDNADAIIHRAVRGNEDLKLLVELIGEEMVQEASRGVDPKQARTDFRGDYKKHPVADAFDLRTLPESKQILRFRNSPVFICDAIDPRSSKKLMKLLDPNPYHRHE